MTSLNQPASSQAMVSVAESPPEEVLSNQAELHVSDAPFFQPDGLDVLQPEPSVSQQANVDMQTTDANGPVVSSTVEMQHHLDNPSASISLPDFVVPHPRIFLDICAGVTRPLSQAILDKGGSVLSFDILLDSRMDLLNDASYEQLLRISASGQVEYGAGSPSCSQYSRAKFIPGGPPPLRTPEYLDGVPGLSSTDLLKVQESYMMLFRVVVCLTLIYNAGGHVHLEQPPSAMSWLEPCVKKFLVLISACCTVMAACAYGKDWYKQWMFAASWPPIASLGKICTHAPGTHKSVVGVLDDTGQYLSRTTACYPLDLAQAFANLVAPLLGSPSRDWTWDSWHELLPKKALLAPPFGQEDGGGLVSNPDWSMGDRIAADSFKTLRQSWLTRIVDWRLDKYISLFFNHGEHTAPPFSEETLAPFRQDLEDFLRLHGIDIDWTIREHQPMHLSILHAFSKIMADTDSALFPCLIAGVGTGFQHDIPRSNCFPPMDRDTLEDVPLSAHHTNWNSAEDDLDLTRKLVQEEVDKGWAFPFNGTLEDAQQQFPLGVSIGKLGVAHSDGRAPRLVLDNSVCGLNSRCLIPERSTLPSAKDVLRTFPLRNFQGDHLGFSLDVKAAHKRIVIREEEHGLLGFAVGAQLYFYRVAPFGATFSASWWSRLGGFLLRLFHGMIWLPHVGLLYVDDFLFYQSEFAMPISATLLCILCQLTGIPISWGKCELAATIQWIGWSIHLGNGYIEIPSKKIAKLLGYLQTMIRSSRTSKKNLEKLIGLAMWITQLWPYMRIWIRHWYHDVFSVPATHFSIDNGDWRALPAHLTDDLIFRSKPQGTAIPIGGRLISVRRKSLTSKADLLQVPIPSKRIWLRIRDPNSSKRTISEHSMRIMHQFISWVSHMSPMRPLTPKPYWPGYAAADACASGTTCGIGGFIKSPNNRVIWFSEIYSHEDFSKLQVQLSEDMQRSISAFETLAQMAILFTAAKFFPAHRVPICLKSLSDNSGAESGSNKLWSMTLPLALFLEKLCLLSVSSGIEIDVNHIPGAQNDLADALSRWNQSDSPPCQFALQDRLRISLSDLWLVRTSPSLHPFGVQIPWSLPT